MITDILYRCPACSSFDWLDGTRCRLCGADVRILSRSEISIGTETHPISHWYRKVLSFDLPADTTGVILKSNNVVLSREAVRGVYKGYAGVVAKRYTRAAFDRGSLILSTSGLSYAGSKESCTIPLEDLSAVTIESNTIIVTSRDSGVMFFDFLEESGKKWEDLIRKALEHHHKGRRIIEFYPRLRFEDSLKTRPSKAKGHPDLRVPVSKWYRPDTSALLTIVRALARPVIKPLFQVKFEGLENMPAKGAAVLLSNHTSFMDSIFLGAFPKRHIWFMAKNSEYKGPLLTWAMMKARSFPVRRYAIDMQAVRNAVRIVSQGHILGIYPEGERTWDNAMLPFRYGTMRLVLALGKPVIPVGITGAYELMPRWTSSMKRSPVKIRIGEPFMLSHVPAPKQTADLVLEAGETIRNRIINLLGEHN